MRTISVICTLLLLAACGGQKPAPGPPKPVAFTPSIIPTNGDDGSPIVVADGSIHVQNDRKAHNFHVHGPRSASIKRANFQPFKIGFQCDPTNKATGAVACSSSTPPCNMSGTNSSTACFVDPGTSPWALTLCESATTPCPSTSAGATLTWDPGVDPEKIQLDFLGADFQIGNYGKGVDLFQATGHSIQSAILTVGGSTTYNFTCTAGSSTKPLACFKIAYSCYVTGDAQCDKDLQ